MRKRLALFASGAGSNAQKLIDHFKNSSDAEVALILSNKANAGALDIARREHIESVLMDKEIYKRDGYAHFLKAKRIHFIILAGFLLKVPPALISAFPRKIINIHPSLLPRYGGRGMYGQFVHEAVIKYGEKESGITIHYVDEHYDHGEIIFQARCPVLPDDTATTLAARVHRLEHEHFPKVVHDCIRQSSPL